MKRLFALSLSALLVGACATAPEPAPSPISRTRALPTSIAAEPQFIKVPLKTQSGVLYVPVGIGTSCCFYFVLDSGSADVTVSPEVFRAMYHDGVIGDQNMIDVMTYKTAAGGTIDGLRFTIPTMMIGGIEVHDVQSSVTKGTDTTMMLLGQTFLQKFSFYAVDHRSGQLVLKL